MSTEPTANILIVDDDEKTLTAMEALLSGPGRNIVTAASGQEALRHLLRRDFALILLDVRLPTMDGFETARRIKQMENYHDTPIIFVTAVFKEDPYIKKGYESGGVDYFTKPFDPEEFHARVAVGAQVIRLQSELADRVKALKAANTIEATPQRVQSKQATAEEPITARIRKRQEANSASDHPVEREISPESSALQPPPAAGDDSSAGQPMTFQERIAMERQAKDREPRLS